MKDAHISLPTLTHLRKGKKEGSMSTSSLPNHLPTLSIYSIYLTDKVYESPEKVFVLAVASKEPSLVKTLSI